MLGDRVDLRTLTEVNSKAIDVCNVEFANDKFGPGKFSSDHLKLSLESKNILDNVFPVRHL